MLPSFMCQYVMFLQEPLPEPEHVENRKVEKEPKDTTSKKKKQKKRKKARQHNVIEKSAGKQNEEVKENREGESGEGDVAVEIE